MSEFYFYFFQAIAQPLTVQKRRFNWYGGMARLYFKPRLVKCNYDNKNKDYFHRKWRLKRVTSNSTFGKYKYLPVI